MSEELYELREVCALGSHTPQYPPGPRVPIWQPVSVPGHTRTRNPRGLAVPVVGTRYDFVTV